MPFLCIQTADGWAGPLAHTPEYQLCMQAPPPLRSTPWCPSLQAAQRPTYEEGQKGLMIGDQIQIKISSALLYTNSTNSTSFTLTGIFPAVQEVPIIQLAAHTCKLWAFCPEYNPTPEPLFLTPLSNVKGVALLLYKVIKWQISIRFSYKDSSGVISHNWYAHALAQTACLSAQMQPIPKPKYFFTSFCYCNT